MFIQAIQQLYFKSVMIIKANFFLFYFYILFSFLCQQIRIITTAAIHFIFTLTICIHLYVVCTMFVYELVLSVSTNFLKALKIYVTQNNIV